MWLIFVIYSENLLGLLRKVLFLYYIQKYYFYYRVEKGSKYRNPSKFLLNSSDICSLSYVNDKRAAPRFYLSIIQIFDSTSQLYKSLNVIVHHYSSVNMTNPKYEFIEKFEDMHGIERIYGYTKDGLKYFLNIREVMDEYRTRNLKGFERAV